MHTYLAALLRKLPREGLGKSVVLITLVGGYLCSTGILFAQPRFRVQANLPNASVVYDSNPNAVVNAPPVLAVHWVTEVIGVDDYGNTVLQDVRYDSYGNVLASSDPYIDINAIRPYQRANRVVYRRRVLAPLPAMRRRIVRRSLVRPARMARRARRARRGCRQRRWGRSRRARGFRSQRVQYNTRQARRHDRSRRKRRRNSRIL